MSFRSATSIVFTATMMRCLCAQVSMTCTRLMNHGVPVTLRVTLHRKNYQYVQEMLDYFIGLGFSRFSLYEYQASGRGSDYAAEYALDTSALEDILHQLCGGSVAEKTD